MRGSNPVFLRMTPDRYRQIKILYQAAEELGAADRSAFLNENCNSDAELRAAVERLLKSSDKVESFIEQPAYEVLSESILTDESKTSVAGKRIGAYKIIREIDHGGMGTVY